MADYSRQGSVAVLEVNNPPVNALSFSVRQGLFNGIERAEQDNGVHVVVIVGKGRTFPAGADIREFKNISKVHQSPGLLEGIARIEACSKPVVAAIHGTAFGGGLEVALACHYRIGLQNCMVGFPEVLLGILPAASGTQKLPRVAGLKAAFDIILSGRSVSAKEALKLKILDHLVKGPNIKEEGIKFAQSIQNEPYRHLRVSQMAVRDVDKLDKLFDDAMLKVKKRTPGLLAPIACLKAIRAAAELPYEEGLKEEWRLAAPLFSSGQSKAMQYAFFAERLATKWQIPGANWSTAKPANVNQAAVIGAGTMGTGIAMALMNAGIPVTLLEVNQKFLDKGVAAIKSLYEGSVRLGKLSPSKAQAILKLLKPTLKYPDLKDADLVIEAVFETMSIKKKVFAELDKVCKPSAFLCSNTSTLDIDEIASATKRPDKVIGTHFFVPAYYMRLLENVRGKKSSPETIATVTKLGTRMGKVPVLVGNCNGFVGNRMLHNYGAEAVFMIEEGAFPHEVDRVAEDFGIPLGPLRVGDLSGLDIGWRIRKDLQAKSGEVKDLTKLMYGGKRYSHLPDILCEMGRFGRKTGAGWYSYAKPGAKVAYKDEAVHDLILDYCRKAGIKRRQIGTQEIFERLFYPLINEGFKILDEGIASKPEDIDTIWLLAYGWPRQTGGPMFYATQIGLPRLYEKIEQYSKKFPYSDYWKPSQLLKRLAEKNVPMESWTAEASSKL